MTTAVFSGIFIVSIHASFQLLTQLTSITKNPAYQPVNNLWQTWTNLKGNYSRTHRHNQALMEHEP